MAPAGQGRGAQTSWECLELEQFKAVDVQCGHPGMGGEGEERDAELHPHFAASSAGVGRDWSCSWGHSGQLMSSYPAALSLHLELILLSAGFWFDTWQC